MTLKAWGISFVPPRVQDMRKLSRRLGHSRPYRLRPRRPDSRHPNHTLREPGFAVDSRERTMVQRRRSPREYGHRNSIRQEWAFLPHRNWGVDRREWCAATDG